MCSKTKVALAAVVTVALTIPLAWQEHAIARARLDNRDRAAFVEQLRSESDAGAAPAQVDTARPQDDHAELERLRTQVAALRSQLEQTRAARLAAAAKGGAQAARRPGFISPREARNVGSATAEALFQTLLWAMSRGDTNRIIELADWSAEGAQQQKAVMVQEMTEAVADPQRAAGIQFRVVRQVALPNGDAAVVIEMPQGDSLHRFALRARPNGAEWRLVVDRNGPQEVQLGEDLNRD